MPSVQWRNDGESKFVLVLTDLDEVATLLLHTFIPVARGKKANGEEFTRYEEFLSRKDPALGEDYDDLEDRLEREPKTRCMGVMVELEPLLEGRKVKGFAVKTETFTRRSDDGEVEVTAPVIGICTQSPVTLWGGINSVYQSLGDLTEVPIQITRRGTDQNTRYDIIPFMEKPVDLAPLLEYIDGISYIGDDMEEVERLVDAEDGEIGKAQAIATFLLNKRIDELADGKRYEDLVSPLELSDMPKPKWGAKKAAAPSSGSSRPARPARPSPRDVAPEAEPSKNEKFAALKSRVEAQG